MRVVVGSDETPTARQAVIVGYATAHLAANLAQAILEAVATVAVESGEGVMAVVGVVAVVMVEAASAAPEVVEMVQDR